MLTDTEDNRDTLAFVASGIPNTSEPPVWVPRTCVLAVSLLAAWDEVARLREWKNVQSGGMASLNNALDEEHQMRADAEVEAAELRAKLAKAVEALAEILVWEERGGYWTHRFIEDADLTDIVLRAFGSHEQARAALKDIEGE